MVVLSVKALVLIQVSIIVLSSFYELSHGEVGIVFDVYDEPVLEPLSLNFGRKRPPLSCPPKQQQPSPPRPVKSPPPSSPSPPVKSPPPSWPHHHQHMLSYHLHIWSQLPTVVSDYHLMQYVLQWAPTTCIKEQKCKACFLNPRANVFSLHGLWPANSTGHSLNCPKSEFTTVGNVDQTLKSDLQKVWPNLLGTDEGFWIHEWKKHGYCTNAIIKDVDYFKTAITINSMIVKVSKNNLVDYLQAAGIHPSNSSFHSKTDIESALYPLMDKNNKVYVSCEEIDNPEGDLPLFGQVIAKVH